MRLADVLGAVVLDADEERVGNVHDVLVRKPDSPPPGDEAMGGLTVAYLVVGGRALGIRLGFEQRVVAGPQALGAIFRWLGRNKRAVPADAVLTWDHHEIRLKTRASDLPLASQVMGPDPGPHAGPGRRGDHR